MRYLVEILSCLLFQSRQQRKDERSHDWPETRLQRQVMCVEEVEDSGLDGGRGIFEERKQPRRPQCQVALQTLGLRERLAMIMGTCTASTHP